MLVDQLLHVIIEPRPLSRQLPTLTKYLLSLLYTGRRLVLKAEWHREEGGKVAERAEQEVDATRAGGVSKEDFSILLYTGRRLVLKSIRAQGGSGEKAKRRVSRRQDSTAVFWS